MSDIKVIKIGGNVIDDESKLSRFLQEFASMKSPRILVHGGGKLATRLAEQLKIETRMIDGRRVTDKTTLDIVTMVYAGLLNKRIVATLQGFGCNALGLSGADAGIIRAVKRSAEPIDFGFVGDIVSVDGQRLAAFAGGGIVPVICSIMHDGMGTLLNCNADSVASAVASGVGRVSPTELIFCFEKNGVLRNVSDAASVIPEITAGTYPALKAEGVISAGMIPKVENALKAVNEGVTGVTIKHSDDLLNDNTGTLIRK